MNTRNWRVIRRVVGIVIIGVVLAGITLHAQDDDDPGSGFVDQLINYDMTVSETIDDVSFFDLWRFTGAQGDVVVITMEASDGLAPQIGLLGPNRELVAASQEGIVDGRVELEYVIQQTGEYIINATRAGRELGDTTGSYTLQLRRASGSESEAITALQDVTFLCRNVEVTTAVTIDFSQSPGEQYEFNLYSFDEFDPALRLELDLPNFDSQCVQDGTRLGGHEISLPDGETLTLSESPENAAQFGVGESDALNRVILTAGSVEGVPGRWALLIEGMRLNTPGEVDAMTLRIGPLAAADSTLTVYMIAGDGTRIDPLIDVYSEGDFDTPARFCDDAGRRECEDVLSLEGYGVIFDEETAFIGDRFDAGVILAPGDISQQNISFRSRATSATGAYTILIIGELPPRE